MLSDTARASTPVSRPDRSDEDDALHALLDDYLPAMMAGLVCRNTGCLLLIVPFLLRKLFCACRRNVCLQRAKSYGNAGKRVHGRQMALLSTVELCYIPSAAQGCTRVSIYHNSHANVGRPQGLLVRNQLCSSRWSKLRRLYAGAECAKVSLLQDSCGLWILVEYLEIHMSGSFGVVSKCERQCRTDGLLLRCLSRLAGKALNSKNP